MPARAETNRELYLQLQRRMIQSGEWDRIEKALEHELNNAGWVDALRCRSKDMARGGERAEGIWAALRSEAQGSVPPHARQVVVGLLRQYMDKQLEG